MKRCASKTIPEGANLVWPNEAFPSCQALLIVVCGTGSDHLIEPTGSYQRPEGEDVLPPAPAHARPLHSLEHLVGGTPDPKPFRLA